MADRRDSTDTNSSGTLRKEILLGVADHCVKGLVQDHQDEARKTLVTSLAANIYENLKSNSNISQLLSNILDPATIDKEAALKSLMSNVSGTLQNSPNLIVDSSEGKRTSSVDSVRTSTISSESQNTSFDKRYETVESEAASEFVYESSCKTHNKEYIMGQQMGMHEVPVTIADLHASPSIPLSVEEISNSSSSDSTNSECTRKNYSDKPVSSIQEPVLAPSVENHSVMLPGKPVCLTQEPVCPTFEPVYSSVEPIWSKQKACHTKEPVSSKQEPVCTNHAPERKRTFSFSEPDRIKPGLPKRTLSFSEQDRKVVSLPPRPSYSSSSLNLRLKGNQNSFQSLESKNEKVENSFKNGETKDPIHPQVSKISKPSLEICQQTFKNPAVTTETPLTLQPLENLQPNAENSTKSVTGSLSCNPVILSDSGDSGLNKKVEHKVGENCQKSFGLRSPEIKINAPSNSISVEEPARSDSQLSQRSLSPLSVGPVPSPRGSLSPLSVGPVIDPIDPLSPLSVGAVVDPIDPEQVEQAQHTFEKLYQDIKDEKHEVKQATSVNSYLSFSEFSESLNSTMASTSHMSSDHTVHHIPIRLLDSAVSKDIVHDPDNINADAESPKLAGLTTPEAAQNDYQADESSFSLHRHEKTTKTQTPDMFTQAQNPGQKKLNKNSFKVDKDVSRLDCKLPPLDDPSVILLSPNPVRRADKSIDLETNNRSYEDDYTDLESLAEDVHHVKEDKARVYIHDKLKDSIHDMVAYQKHSDDETRPKSHFQELKDNQKKVQMDFHAKLFQELAKESTEGGKPSAVAEALGTSYEVRKSNSTHHVHPTGYNSVPSKSPNMSRRGSSGHLNTWMSKSPFWSNSLPRQKRRVKFDDEPPERPPPPPPERTQSINTMKTLSGISTVYNQTLQDETDLQQSRQHDVYNQQQQHQDVHNQQQNQQQKQHQGVHTQQQQHQGVHNQQHQQQQHKEVYNQQQQLHQEVNNQQQHQEVNNHQQQHHKEVHNQQQQHQEVHNQHQRQRNQQQQQHQQPCNTDTLQNPDGEAIHQSAALSKPSMNSSSNMHRSAALSKPLMNSGSTSDLSSLQSVEYREFSKHRNVTRAEDEYKLDLGERKDRWMELYGKSVLNNTLQDRRGGSGLQRSQSAVWNTNQEVTEHEAVISTDRLEKPKHPAPPPNQTNMAAPSTLPRNFSSRASYQNGLRRNASMSDVHVVEHNTFSSPRIYHKTKNAGNINATTSHSSQNMAQNHESQASSSHIQVPPHIVKSIVISVLEKQGVPNPSDDIINKAIQEYYAKNPQGVFVGSGSEGVLQSGDRILSINSQNTDNITHVEAQNLFKNSGTKAQLEVGRIAPAPPKEPGMLPPHLQDQQRVQSQPHHTTPLVGPVPKTSHETTSSETQHSTSTLEQYKAEPYRNKTLALANPKTIHDAIETERRYCSTTLDKQTNEPYRTLPLVQANPKTILEAGDAERKYCTSTLERQKKEPYRTTPLVLPNPKTILDAGEAERKYCTQTVEKKEPKPYRTASLIMPGPKTINESGAGAPTYQPYRGPQYNTQINKGGIQGAQGLYNSPVPLYSEETLVAEPNHPGFVQATKPQLPSSNQATISNPQDSATFKIVLESEIGAAKNQPVIVGRSFEGAVGGGERPVSQASDRSRESAMRNSNINQSASFKKVMYSVLGESEF